MFILPIVVSLQGSQVETVMIRQGKTETAGG